MTPHEPPTALSVQNPGACAHCGAVVVRQARSCWLCGGKITPSAAQDALPVVRHSPLMQPLTHTQALMFWLGAIVATLVGYGVVRLQDAFFAAIYLLAVVPALLVMLIGATTARAAGRPWTPAKAAGVGAIAAGSALMTVAAAVAITIVIVALLVVSMIVAFFAFCTAVAGGQ